MSDVGSRDERPRMLWDPLNLRYVEHYPYPPRAAAAAGQTTGGEADERVVANTVDSARRCAECGERCTSLRALAEHESQHQPAPSAGQDTERHIVWANGRVDVLPVQDTERLRDEIAEWLFKQRGGQNFDYLAARGDDVLNRSRGEADELLALPALRQLVDERDKARAMLDRLAADTNAEPCRWDHHGYCQEHGWLGPEPGCGDRDAHELLQRAGLR